MQEAGSEETMTRHWTTLLVAAACVPLAAQNVSHAERLPTRRYVEGDRLQYLMKAQNNGSTYEVRVTATTKKAADGRFVDELAWSDMVVNGAPRALAATSQAFRLAMTLEGGAPFELPDLSKAPGLIGPVTDVLTFYSDLFLAMHQGAASVGKETFDVKQSIALSNGKILSATMDNPVTKVARVCSDAALTLCGDAKLDPTLRRIEMSLLRE